LSRADGITLKTLHIEVRKGNLSERDGLYWLYLVLEAIAQEAPALMERRTEYPAAQLPLLDCPFQ
jgi:hypothetical protein